MLLFIFNSGKCTKKATWLLGIRRKEDEWEIGQMGWRKRGVKCI